MANDNLKNPESNVDRQTASLIQQSIAPNTLKAYQHALKRFHTWLHANNLDPDHLTDDIVAKYIAELYADGKAPATITIVVSAIKWEATNAGVSAVVGELTDKTLTGIRRSGQERGRGQVDGLTWADVDRICTLAEAEKTIVGLRDSAMIRLMSDCLLRISETVAINVEDLGENALTVRRSKEDQEGNGTTLFVGIPTMEVIEKYKAAGSIKEGPLFRRVRRGDRVTRDRLGVNGARVAIKTRAQAAGVKGLISGHSLRVGSAVSLARAGASVADMQVAGRWKEPRMPVHYARAELVEQGGIARFKYNKTDVKTKFKRGGTISMVYGSGDYRYEVVEGWGQIPQLGLASAVACDSQDRVYVFNRSPNPAMLVFERDGQFIGSWGEDIFKAPHGIWISPDDEIYTTDTDDHTVRRFTLSGELLQTWGTVDEPGPPGQPFNRPTRAVLSQSGEMYVSDGYGQSRVHRMTLDGEVIVSWGAPGSGPGEFNLPHDVTVDKNDRVYILDRGNLRCQIFDSNGKYLTEWGELRSPNDLFIDSDNVIHIAEGGQRITVMTLDGEIITQWGEKGEGPGQFSNSPHGIWIDSHGAVYISEVIAEKRFQKFVRV